MHELISRNFELACPKNVHFSSLRFVEETTEELTIQRGVLEPVNKKVDTGVMVTVHHNGGLGYASTPDLSVDGLKRAFQLALNWAERTSKDTVIDTMTLDLPHPKGSYKTAVERSWGDVSLKEKLNVLQSIDGVLCQNKRIVDWYSSLMSVRVNSLYLTNEGGRIDQQLEMLAPGMMAVANDGRVTQKRSFGSRGVSQQGGMEILDRVGFVQSADRIVQEALQLLTAPDCPSGKMDLILTADQMMLQIHESIGHPLELDRILGDERNYAGTSFVTLDMFGTYQYGSSLLNVTFDPTVSEEFASYKYDDHGTAAKKSHIIENGVLKRPLGGMISQSRAMTDGVANSRASSWNRPPIDRMANLNVEPGNKSLEELISSVEKGVLMRTNTSWSIDDSRNKFQFGCEFGELIENGKIVGVVKNPNYRGVSANFWRSLKGVGNHSTFEVLGTPYCGKGEPNQIIRVGHASPACLFGNVDIFGGA
jgi:predicted Zn-dependent protease